MQSEGYSGPSRALVRTRSPGIFRRGDRYVVVYREPNGKQRKQAAETLAAARALQAEVRNAIARGSYRAQSNMTFADYATSWIASYGGRTSKGIEEHTRADYRRRLERDAIPFFGRLKLAAIEPRHIKQYAAKLAAPRTDREMKESGCHKRTVAMNTVRLGIAPVRACLGDAMQGLITTNPAAGLRLFVRPRSPSSLCSSEP